MIQDEKLDRIIALLERLCSVIDPKPGYERRGDGQWYNRATGAHEFDDAQRAWAAIRLRPGGMEGVDVLR